MKKEGIIMAEGITYLCPGCGAYLRYDGGQGKWFVIIVIHHIPRGIGTAGAKPKTAAIPSAPVTAAKPKPWTLPVKKMWQKARIREHLGHASCPNCGAKS